MSSMPKFSSSIFDNRKTIFFVLLFFVVFFSTFLGTKINLANADTASTAGCMVTCSFACGPGTIVSDVALCENCMESCLGHLGVITPAADATCLDKLSWYKQFVAGISHMANWGAKQLADLATKLSSWVIKTVLDWPVTKGPNGGAASAFAAGWATVRDLANMLVVLGFVIIGIATALRIREYEAKKALWPLIIVAILINFSSLLCGLFIDASRIVMNGFTQSGQSAAPLQNIFAQVAKTANGATCEAANKNDLWAFVSADIMFAIVYLIIGLSFLFLAGTLLVRYVALGILFMLSPIAFVFYAFPFPKAKDFWTKWWNSFLKWIFIGVGLTFFIRIAANMLEKADFKNATSGTTLSIDLIGYIFVVIMVLIVGLYSSIKGSGALGATLTAMGGAVGGIALGAVGGIAKVTGAAGLARRAGQGIKDKATGFGERVGVVRKGTTEANKQSRLSEPTKRLEQIQNDAEGNAKLAKIAEQRPITATQSTDKAAAAQILAKRNAFGTIDPRKRDTVAAHAQTYGVSKETFTKSNPELLATATDKEATEKVRNDLAAGYLNSGTAKNMKKAQKMASIPHPTDVELGEANLAIKQRRMTENALGINPVTDKDIMNKLTEDKQKSKPYIGMSKDAVARAMKGWQPSEKDIVNTRESLSQERIQKGFAKLGKNGITDAPKELLSNPDFVKYVGYQPLSKALPEMSKDKTDEIKKILPTLRKEILSGLKLTSAAGATAVEAEIVKLEESSVATDKEKGKNMRAAANKYLLIENH